MPLAISPLITLPQFLWRMKDTSRVMEIAEKNLTVPVSLHLGLSFLLPLSLPVVLVMRNKSMGYIQGAKAAVAKRDSDRDSDRDRETEKGRVKCG